MLLQQLVYEPMPVHIDFAWSCPKKKLAPQNPIYIHLHHHFPFNKYGIIGIMENMGFSHIGQNIP